MKRFLAAAMALILAGCTTYQDAVGSYWPARDTLVVSGRGNGFTSGEAIGEYVILKAAEEGLRSGYRYFVLLDQADQGSTTYSTYTTPRTTTYNAYNYGGYVSGTATTTGGTQVMPVYKPGLDASFKMFDQPPPGFRPGQYYSAVDIYNEYGPKYLGEAFKPAR